MFSELNLNAADLIPLWAFRFVDVKELVGVGSGRPG